MSGPAKLNENTKILRADPLLTDDMFGATSGTGAGKVFAVSKLVALLSAVVPVTSYANTTAHLANTTIAVGYFAYVVDAAADPSVGSGNALYLYQGGARSSLSSYVLVTRGKDRRPALSDWDLSGNVMPVSADAVGSGAAGAILRGDEVYITVTGDADGENRPVGTIGKALQNNPTSGAHWRYY